MLCPHCRNVDVCPPYLTNSARPEVNSLVMLTRPSSEEALSGKLGISSLFTFQSLIVEYIAPYWLGAGGLSRDSRPIKKFWVFG